MYTFLLYAHSWLRWTILALAIVNIIKSFTGWKGSKPFDKGANGMSAGFVGSIHLMALLGLVLYFFYSPFGFQAFGGEVSPMKNAALRYWSVEHIFVMIAAVTVATIGRAKAKKATEAAKKYKTQFIFFTIALVLMLSRIPFNEAARLFRF